MIGQAVTAAICTRNRGIAVVAAMRSVLANRDVSFRLVVVDQSTNDESAEAVAPFLSDPRVKYVRTETVGLSTARNIALRNAETDVVVFTDDDCEVPEGWLAAMHSVFTEYERVAVAFCSVHAGPFEASAGFVPAYTCQGTRIINTFFGKCTARGIGAGIAVRKSIVLDALGGFDEMLGAGGEYPSCEDGDAAVRSILAGYDVCETDRTFVIHHGFRSWAEGRELGKRDWVGTGAAYAKPLRVGRWDFMPVPLYELLAKALWPPLSDLVHLRPPRGVARSFHFLGGFVRGLRAPLDRDHLVFRVAPKS